MFGLQGDDYQSFWGFIGLAGFFFSVARSVTGHWTKISYAVSGLFLLLALSWPWTKDIFPAVTSITAQLAGSSVFWAVLIIVLIGILTVSGRPKTIQNLASAVDQLRSEVASIVLRVDNETVDPALKSAAARFEAIDDALSVVDQRLHEAEGRIRNHGADLVNRIEADRKAENTIGDGGSYKAD